MSASCHILGAILTPRLRVCADGQADAQPRREETTETRNLDAKNHGDAQPRREKTGQTRNLDANGWVGGSGVGALGVAGLLVAAEDVGQHGPMGRASGRVSCPPLVGDADEDAAPVVVAHRPTDQTGLFESGDQPRQGTLAQVRSGGELLDAEAVAALLDHEVEDLEVARTDPMPGAELVLEGTPGRGVLGE
jgi:hypothetical protein